MVVVQRAGRGAGGIGVRLDHDAGGVNDAGEIVVEVVVRVAAGVSVGGGLAGRKIIVDRAGDGGRGDGGEIVVAVVSVAGRAPDVIRDVGEVAVAVVGKLNRTAQRVGDVRQLAGRIVGVGHGVAVAVNVLRNFSRRGAGIERVEHPLALVRKRHREHAAGKSARPEKSGAGVSAVALRIKRVRATRAVIDDDVRAVRRDENVGGEIPAVAGGRIRRPDP